MFERFARWDRKDPDVPQLPVVLVIEVCVCVRDRKRERERERERELPVVLVIEVHPQRVFGGLGVWAI